MLATITLNSHFLRHQQAAVRRMLEPHPKSNQKSGLDSVSQPHRFFNWSLLLFLFFTLTSIGLLVVLFGPALYYKVFPGDPVPISSSETGTPLGGRFDQGVAGREAAASAGQASGSAQATSSAQVRTVTLPAYDPTLPDGNWVIIPRIGVRSEIYESDQPEPSLEKGVWRVPDYGTPGDLTKPMILAAHRYGYIWWWQNGSNYWKYHSFYLLPDTQQGDLVEVISGKRKYIYEIYAGEEGETITDYNADLILYTCKFLTGEKRYFRYARLVDPNVNTQS